MSSLNICRYLFNNCNAHRRKERFTAVFGEFNFQVVRSLLVLLDVLVNTFHTSVLAGHQEPQDNDEYRPQGRLLSAPSALWPESLVSYTFTDKKLHQQVHHPCASFHLFIIKKLGFRSKSLKLAERYVWVRKANSGYRGEIKARSWSRFHDGLLHPQCAPGLIQDFLCTGKTVLKCKVLGWVASLN